MSKDFRKSIYISNIAKIFLLVMYLAFLSWRMFFYAYSNIFRASSRVYQYNIIPLSTIYSLLISYSKYGFTVWDDKRPSHMLEDRLLQGIQLYKNGASDRLLMSGDHGSKEYDEVNVMKKFAIHRGIVSEHIFMDHAGFSTYESLYRTRDIFEAKKIIIVTQKYHLYRALYIAEKLGLEAYGVASNPRQF